MAAALIPLLGIAWLIPVPRGWPVAPVAVVPAEPLGQARRTDQTGTRLRPASANEHAALCRRCKAICDRRRATCLEEKGGETGSRDARAAWHCRGVYTSCVLRCNSVAACRIG